MCQVISVKRCEFCSTASKRQRIQLRKRRSNKTTADDVSIGSNRYKKILLMEVWIQAFFVLKKQSKIFRGRIRWHKSWNRLTADALIQCRWIAQVQQASDAKTAELTKREAQGVEKSSLRSSDIPILHNNVSQQRRDNSIYKRQASISIQMSLLQQQDCHRERQ